MDNFGKCGFWEFLGWLGWLEDGVGRVCSAWQMRSRVCDCWELYKNEVGLGRAGGCFGMVLMKRFSKVLALILQSVSK